MAGALVWAMVTGEWHVFFLATVWHHHDSADPVLVLLTLVAAGLRGWLIWMILVRTPYSGPAWVRLLRFLLYLSAVFFLLGPLMAAVSEAGVYVGYLVTLPVFVLLPLVFRQAPLVIRVIVAAVGVSVCLLPFVVPMPPGVTVFWPVAVVLLQVFCRWSPVTRWLGLIALVYVGVMSVLPGQFVTYSDLSPVWLLTDAFAVTQALWLARTAADLGRDHAAGPAAPIVFRVAAVVLASTVAGLAASVVLSPPLTVVNEIVSGDELVATIGEEVAGEFDDPMPGCERWTALGEEYVTTPPHEREKAYLCLARWGDERPGVTDATLLAEGRARCAADPIYGHEVGRLVYLCPETAGVVDPELLFGRTVVDAMHAACQDPWPGVGPRKGFPTVPYLLEKPGEGYRVVTHRLRDGTPGWLDEVPVAVGAGVQGVCLTHKTLKRPPPLRADGWRSVVEVPLLSHGSVMLRGLDPNFLDSTGEGRQRMRVYTRDLTVEGLRAEQHLLVTFPGRSTRMVVHK
ncbi:hypothetical protein [Herbidospora daliensis]|uniref:hypothetical protein n=1 Tax=Herbidospora daliensis TaxID=295585 RepID=UPI000A8BADFE|nr:hypothetical protein [Herbidospora daliensis]